MKRNLLLSCIATVCSFGAYAQSTDSLNSPQVWLRADVNTNPLVQWMDVGFFKRHATSHAEATPLFNASLNYNPAVLFDGVDDKLTIPYSLEGLSELTVFAVFNTSDTTERGVWGMENESTRSTLLTTRRAIGPDTISDAYGKFEKLATLNTLVQNWETSSSALSTSTLSLGSAGEGTSFKPFKGAISELIIFNRNLPFLERVKYETYLALKYGTGLKGGNFVSSQEKVLWRVEENKAFGRNIAGIGRDNAFKLYQKQSASAYDSGLLIITTGQLASSNFQNSATFADQNFLVWGDNGLPINLKRGLGADSVLTFIQRKWLMTATGESANSLPVELHVDQTKFPSDPLGYWLVIDRSGSADFSVDNLEYILPDRVADGKIVYKNVRWDTDGSGKDHFGFAKAKEFFAVARIIHNPLCTDETRGEVNIEIIAGEAPFQHAFKNADGKTLKEWRQSSQTSSLRGLTVGNYIVTVQDADKEKIEKHFTLIMPDALNFTLGPDRKLDEPNDIILSVASQIPSDVEVSYRWENSFGYASNEESINVKESGIYTVIVTKQSDGCEFRDAVAVSGADEQRLAVYPNVLKSHETYNVSISLEEAGSVSVRVFNSRGIEVSSVNGSDHAEYQFVTSLNDPGMYLVVIQTPKGIETRKVVAY